MSSARTIISFFKGVERSLNVQVVFMTLLFCISDFSSHPEHILLLRAVRNINSVLLSLGGVLRGGEISKEEAPESWVGTPGMPGLQLCFCRLALAAKDLGSHWREAQGMPVVYSVELWSHNSGWLCTKLA